MVTCRTCGGSGAILHYDPYKPLPTNQIICPECVIRPSPLYEQWDGEPRKTSSEITSPLWRAPSGPADVSVDMRPDWDWIWMELAGRLADRSTCSRAKVGAVVVSYDNHRVLAIGYNGSWRGGPNGCDNPSVAGDCGCLHSEQNSLVKLDYNDPSSRKMYVTMAPCVYCAKLAVNAKISEVIYEKEYRKAEGLEILRQAGVTVRQLAPSPEQAREP